MDHEGWKISSWSTELGRGVIESAAGTLPFDGSFAEVHDFVIGEPVEVELRRAGESYAVVRIRPAGRPKPPAPSFGDPIPAALEKATRALTSLLEDPDHVVLLVAATEERLELAVANKDWPPPHGKPLGTAVFEGVSYIHLPTSADHFHRVVAWRWEAVQAHRPGVCAGFAISDGEVEAGSFLFAFEPESSDEAPGYVVAASLRTKRGLFR